MTSTFARLGGAVPPGDLDEHIDDRCLGSATELLYTMRLAVTLSHALLGTEFSDDRASTALPGEPRPRMTSGDLV